MKEQIDEQSRLLAGFEAKIELCENIISFGPRTSSLQTIKKRKEKINNTTIEKEKAEKEKTNRRETDTNKTIIDYNIISSTVIVKDILTISVYILDNNSKGHELLTTCALFR